jgi:hypothetical protein
MLMAGPTYRDIFNARIRIGTFSEADMPNHFFLAVLTSSQISGPIGKKWLAILKEAGFEFIRTVDNSVYTGPSLSGTKSSHPNYVFGLFRNIGNAAIADPFAPPKEWTDLPEQTKTQTEIWEETSPTKLITESEAVAAGATIIMAGKRSQYPQEPKTSRDAKEAAAGKKPAPAASPFAMPAAVAPVNL